MNSQSPRRPEETAQITALIRAGRFDEAYAAVYTDLKTLARRELDSRGQQHATLDSAAVVGEGYLKLAHKDWSTTINDRVHLFRLAARAMRQVILSDIERKSRTKHGGHLQRQTLPDTWMWGLVHDAEVGGHSPLAAVLAALEERDPAASNAIDLRFFCGFTIEEAAAWLGVSASKVKRDTARGKLFIKRHLDDF